MHGDAWKNQLTEDFFLDVAVDDGRKKCGRVVPFAEMEFDGCDALFMTLCLFRCFSDTLLFLAFRWCFALLHSWALTRSAIRKNLFHFRAAMAGAVAGTDVMGRTFLLMTGGKEGGLM